MKFGGKNFKVKHGKPAAAEKGGKDSTSFVMSKEEMD